MATFINSFKLLDENELIGIVDAKAEDAFLAVVKKNKEEEKKKKGEEEKKMKKPQGQRKTEFWYSNPRPIRAKRLVLPRSFLKSQIVLCKNKDQDQGQGEGNGVQVKDSAQSDPINGQSQNGADPKAVRPVSGTASTGSEGSNHYNGPPQRANGGQYYGRANRGYNYPRRYYQEGNGGYEGRGQSHVEDGGQNYGRVNEGYNGNYDQQRAQGGFRNERGRWWRGNGYQGRGRYFEAENNHGNNNGLGLEKEEGSQVVVEEEQQEQGGVEEGNTQQQIQSNDVHESSNKSSSEGKKKPNINGSLRRKLKKQKKEAEANKNQGDNNAAAAPEGTSAAVSSVSVQKKFTDTFTLKEYEKEVAKKKDVEVVKKSSDGDCDRTETLVKEFESMRVIGKKKLEEEKKVSVPKPQDKSAEVNRKKDGANVKIKTQTININEFHRPQNKKKDGVPEGHDSQKDGRIEGHHHSHRDGRFERNHHSHRDGRFERNHHSQRDGRFEGHHSKGDGRFKGHHSQMDGRFEGRQPPVKNPASFEIDEGQFPDLGKSRILIVKKFK
ncbi:uncharacterized protein LOC110757655 [Prunus avium]|uniref:Uncharacterized protein LOC110757655 n=1 Tax=Prunus avium TaxID=42229 RepID=A0A6P5SMQ4_PRUAV|nr:uncharacterized protein LOC110757655 [Prunus avium]